MKIVEVVLNTVRNTAISIVLVGLLSLAVGVIIILYPDLLGILVGIVLIISGIIWLVLGTKLSKYSKIKMEM